MINKFKVDNEKWKDTILKELDNGKLECIITEILDNVQVKGAIIIQYLLDYSQQYCVNKKQFMGAKENDIIEVLTREYPDFSIMYYGITLGVLKKLGIIDITSESELTKRYSAANPKYIVLNRESEILRGIIIS